MSNIIVARNLLGDALVVSASNADAKYGVEALRDGFPSRPFRFADSTAPWFRADLQLFGTAGVDEGTFEGGSGATFPGWINNGTVARETTTVHGGAAAVKLTGATASVRRILKVQADRLHHVEAWCYPNASQQFGIIVYDNTTGKTLQTDGTWGASFVPCAVSAASGAWEKVQKDFRTQAALTALSDEVELYVYLYHNSGSGDIFVDDAGMWPGVDLSSFHGHDFSPTWTVVLQRSDDGSSWTTEHTFTLRQPTFYGLLSSVVYRRYWRVSLSGGTSSTPAMHVGEWGLGQGLRLATNPEYPLTLHHEMRQVRTPTQVINLEDWPRRVWSAPHSTSGTAEYQEIREEIFARTGFGKEPLILIPKSDDAEVCLYGRVRPTWDPQESILNIREFPLEVEELPLPTWSL
jgi:hypothetical protein